MRQDWDLVVAGGGLAGLAAATCFAREGHRVLLLEKYRYPFHKVCGEYLSNESLPFLKKIGLDLGSLDLPQIHHLELSAPNGHRLEQELELGGTGISRYLLDKLLAEKAREAGVHIHESEEVVQWTHQHDAFSVVSSKSVYRCRLLLAAYGKKAKPDRQIQRSFLQKKEDYVAVKYHIRLNIPQDRIFLHNFKNGYCGMSAIEDGRVCLCYLTRGSDLRRAGSILKLEQDQLLLNPHLREIWRRAEFLYEQPLTISGFGFRARNQTESGAAFAGDAAGLITPLCGNGMSMALRSAKLFYEVYSPVLAGYIPLNEAAREYEERWNSVFGLRLKAGRAIQSMFGSPGLTNLFLFALSPFPSLRKNVVRATHGKPF